MLESRTRRAIAAGVISVILPVANTACFGSFGLTRQVYDFNEDVSSDKWLTSLLFVGMVVVPVYEAAALIDAVFGNAVEFWGGDNPLNEGATRTAVAPDGTKMTMTLRRDGAIQVLTVHPDGREQRFVLLRAGDTVEAHDAQGGLIVRVGNVDGQPRLLGGALAR